MKLQEIIDDLDMFLNENTVKKPAPKPEPVPEPVDYSEAKGLEVAKIVISGIEEENVSPDVLADRLFEASVHVMESLLEGPDHADDTFEESIKFFEQVALKAREILQRVSEEDDTEEEDEEDQDGEPKEGK